MVKLPVFYIFTFRINLFVRMKYLFLFLVVISFGFTCGEDTTNPYLNTAFSVEWENGVQTGKLQGNFADEMSGMVASIMNPGLYWIHNDGSIKKLFLIDTLGNKYAELRLPTNIAFTDVEDISCGKLNGTPTLFIGDLGDNDFKRANYSIHKIIEPTLSSGEEKSLGTDDLTSITFSYTDARSYDSESLMYDPIESKLIIISKSDPSYVFEIDAMVSGTLLNLTPLGSIPAQSLTAACISADGRRTLLRTLTTTFVFINQPGVSLSQQLLSDLPSRGPTLLETKGEAICFNLSTSGFLTCSEAAGTGNQPIFYYKRK